MRNGFLGNDAGGAERRREFLGRVRKALGRGADEVVIASGDHPLMREELVRQVEVGDKGMVNRWEQLAKNNGMRVERVGRGGVLGAMERALANHAEVKRVMVCAGALGDGLGVEGFLRGKGLAVEKWGEAGSRDVAFHCDASVTDCRAGLADTGAFLVWSDAGFGRSVALTSPVHIVLLPVEKILADMVDGFALVRKQTGDALPSNVVVINGPSKTADIEMNLVTGVHGPKYLYVVLIDG